MANLSLLGLWLHWTASVEHRQYCRLIIWKYLVAALVPVSEEVCRSVDVYQRGKLLTLELKTGTLLKLGVRFKVTLVVVNLLWNIGNVIWVEAYHYFQVILLIIGGNWGQFWAVLGCIGLYRAEISSALQGCTGLCWAVLGCAGLYWDITGSAWLYWADLGCTGL